MSKTLMTAITCIALLSTHALSANAQDKTDQKAKNPVLEEFHNFSKDLPAAEKRHFNVIYSNYNLISVVQSVEHSVDKAVKSCADNNPDMKEPLEERFSTWKGEVHPIVEDARASIDNMIIAQDYAKAKDIRALLKKIDTVRTEQAKDTQKVPVNTPEACKYLLEKMDETQPQMVQLLKSTLVSLPQRIQVEKEDTKEQ